MQRVLVGPLRALAGLNIERWKLAPRTGPSVFATDLAIDPSIGVPTNEFSARVGLVFDTRDDEVASGRGVLLEAIWGVADSSVAGDLSYTRTTLSARGFVTPSPRVQLGARVVGQIMGGSPRVGSLYLIEGSDRFYEGIGGGETHRALLDNRLLGRDKLFANIDVRYALFAIPTLYRVSLLGFLDAGRVFDVADGEDFEVTTNGLKVGAGSGFFVQIGRAGVAGFTVGLGPDGISSDFLTKWTF
jgi:outer membrane protein assembly factor BamA